MELHVLVDSTPRICPNCSTLLERESKRLGKRSKQWMVCPECGYREEEIEKQIEVEEQNDRMAYNYAHNKSTV